MDWIESAMTEPTVAGEPAADRLRKQIIQRNRLSDEPAPSPQQVMVVLRALADYTHMMAAVDGGADPAHNVASWMHAVADQIERQEWAREGEGERAQQ
jgi:hypothetical protein